MDADDLYGLPLDAFVAERGALAKELRNAGNREEAAEVAALRKPSVAAWAVNQLVRTQRPAVRELFEAGDELRDAQSDLLSGTGDGRSLRAAGERERAAVDDLVERARGLLSSAGNELSPTVIERVSDTLHAAALDEDAREQICDGRLERELRHVGLGFGLGVGTPPVPAPRAPAAAKRPKKGAGSTAGAKGAPAAKGGMSSPAADKAGSAAAKKRAERERAAEQRAEEERERRERAAARRDARAAHASARRRADAASRALDAAQERRDETAQALDAAEQALAVARDDAADAKRALARAQAQLEEAERKR